MTELRDGITSLHGIHAMGITPEIFFWHISIVLAECEFFNFGIFNHFLYRERETTKTQNRYIAGFTITKVHLTKCDIFCNYS